MWEAGEGTRGVTGRLPYYNPVHVSCDCNTGPEQQKDKYRSCKSTNYIKKSFATVEKTC